MEIKYDKSLNKTLFGIDFQNDFSEEEFDKAVSMAEELTEKLGQDVVFSEWYQYLEERIDNKKAAHNFMIAFYNFGGHDFRVANPYPFLTSLYCKLGLSIAHEPDKADEEIFETFDSIYTSMLIKSGLVSADDYFDLNLFDDQKFIEGLSKLNS